MINNRVINGKLARYHVIGYNARCFRGRQRRYEEGVCFEVNSSFNFREKVI